MNSFDDRALLAALLDGAIDAIVISDRHGNILRSNKSAAELFGYSQTDLLGRNVGVLMPEELALRHPEYVRHHLDTGERPIIGRGREVLGRKVDGTEFPLFLLIGRADIDGKVAFVAFLRDLTHRKAAEEAAVQSQRMDAIGRMTSAISHDFNNLLTIVIGNLELLEMSNTSDKDRALIADALEAAQLGADLTSRLMVLSRRAALESDVIALNDVVETSLSTLKRSIGAHIAINFELAEDLWPTRADATQLQTSVLNLALNAQDAMPEGGTIFVETRNITLDDNDTGIDPGHYVCLSVSDTGEGMSAQTRRHATEPFFTTKPVGKGIGLGLSIVHGFVTQSRGHLTIYSEIGHGTTISLFFPALLDEDPHAGTDDRADGAAKLGAGRLALVVDDDPRFLRLSNTRLTRLGFSCISARTGDDAWDILKDRSDIALVFTDLVMPGRLSGHQLAQRMAEHQPQVRVLLTSGFSQGVLRGGRIGAEYPILRKPFRQVDLANALLAVMAEELAPVEGATVRT